MSKPTLLADSCYTQVLILAAKGYIETSTCICDEVGELGACFTCEVKAAIQKAKEELNHATR